MVAESNKRPKHVILADTIALLRRMHVRHLWVMDNCFRLFHGGEP